MLQTRRAICLRMLHVEMDVEGAASWPFSPTEFLASVELENTRSGGGCGGGHHTWVLFRVCPTGESSAVSSVRMFVLSTGPIFLHLAAKATCFPSIVSGMIY